MTSIHFSEIVDSKTKNDHWAIVCQVFERQGMIIRFSNCRLVPITETLKFGQVYQLALVLPSVRALQSAT